MSLRGNVRPGLSCLIVIILSILSMVVFPNFAQPIAHARTTMDLTRAGNDYGIGAIQQARLTASDLRQLDEFGWSVAIDRDTAVIGARNADPDLGHGTITNAGAAYVFRFDGLSWAQEARLVADDASPGDSFGVSVGIWGDTIAIGATGHDHDGLTDAGAVYLFRRQGGEWKQISRLIAADSASEDNFGSAIALYNDTLVVGANSKDLLAIPDVGAAYIFVNRGNSWDQKRKLLPSNPVPGGNYGASAAISDHYIVVGEIQANPFGLRGDGSVYIYEGHGRNWSLSKQISLDDGRRGDFFGNAVALSGERLVVGAVFRDVDQLVNSGAVYVFERSGSDWNIKAALTAPDAQDFDRFGASVAASGNVIVVGARDKSQAGLSTAGAAYIFSKQGKAWSEPVKIVADTVNAGDHFGNAVAISGERLIVGAVGRDPLNLQQAGEAFAYKIQSVLLPETGFPPNRTTLLPAQPAGKAYAELNDLHLEIPKLKLEAEIVGVPRSGDGWDTTWLWDRVGYLEGTAFPTWQGNTALAAHAYLPTGAPGPYSGIDRLGFGDQILLHAWGQKYIYEVRRVLNVLPADLSVLAHEQLDWVTLITCEDFDALTAKFNRRLVVQAVLVRVESD